MLEQQISLVEKWLVDSKSVSDEELLANEWQAYQYYQQEFPNFPSMSRNKVCAGAAACAAASPFAPKSDTRLRGPYKISSRQDKAAAQQYVNTFRKLK